MAASSKTSASPVPDLLSVLLQPVDMLNLPVATFLHGAAYSSALEDVAAQIKADKSAKWWDKHSLVMLCCDTAQFHFFVAVVAGPGPDLRRAYHYVNEHGTMFDDGECVETDMSTMEFCAVRAFVVPAIAMPDFDMRAHEYMQNFAASGDYVIFTHNCRSFAEAFLQNVVRVPQSIVLDVFEAAGALIGTTMSDFLGTLSDFWRGVYTKLTDNGSSARSSRHPYGVAVWKSTGQAPMLVGTRVKDLHSAAALARAKYAWKRARSEWERAPLVFNQ